MAKFGQTFNAAEIDTTQNDFELLPTGIYRLEATAADIKQDDNDNTQLNVAFDVVEPEEYAKRKFFVWIDLEHKDAAFQERGQKELAKLCRALEISEVEDSDDLLFKVFTAKVKKGEAGVSKAGRPYKARNSIQRYFYPDEGNVPEPAIDENQPKAPANDNRQPPANSNNRPAAPTKGTGTTGKRPW